MLPKLKPRDRYISDQELDAFLKTAPPFICAYVAVKLATGLRQGDMLNMRLDDLTEEGILVTTRKTGTKGIVEWTPELRKAIDNLIESNPAKSDTYVICNLKGQKLSSNTFQHQWGDAMKAALIAGENDPDGLKLKFTEHDLRAKHATDIETLGGNATNNLLHENRATTKSYLRNRKAIKITPLTHHLKGK
nr:tyrosine-type recombinase/integrase [Hahella sp. HN01]